MRAAVATSVTYVHPRLVTHFKNYFDKIDIFSMKMDARASMLPA